MSVVANPPSAPADPPGSTGKAAAQRSLATAASQGAVAGLAGGLAFGAAMAQLGVLPTVAALVRVDSPIVGFIVHLLVAAVLGAGFGVLLRTQRTGAGETVLWGLAYGMAWWYLGALTLLPLLSGQGVEWTAEAAAAAFPSLLGHLTYGLVAAGVLAWLRERDGRGRRASGAALLRGAVGGTLAALLLVAVLDGPRQPLAGLTAMAAQPDLAVAVAVLGLGALAGVGYALLHPAVPETTGPALVRGLGYGFVLWVVLGLTVLPLLETGSLAWTADDARAAFPTLPGLLLLGALTAGFSSWLGRAGRLLFAGPTERSEDEGSGVRGVRAVGYGAVAGAAGGLLFTVVMVGIGALETVAGLVGSQSAAVGVVVHLGIAVVIGVSYGLLFQRQSHDVASGLGWGMAYGFGWWILGALTLLPVGLGGSPQWEAAAAVAAFPNLVGHLAYGAGLGVVFHLLETRHDPWWITRTAARAARAARHRDHLASAAPAVSVLVVLLAVTVTILLGADPAAAG